MRRPTALHLKRDHLPRTLRNISTQIRECLDWFVVDRNQRVAHLYTRLARRTRSAALRQSFLIHLVGNTDDLAHLRGEIRVRVPDT